MDLDNLEDLTADQAIMKLAQVKINDVDHVLQDAQEIAMSSLNMYAYRKIEMARSMIKDAFNQLELEE